MSTNLVTSASSPMPAALARLARRVESIPGSVIDSSISLLQRQEREVISFAMGCPADALIPIEAFKDIASEIFEDPSAFNYGPTEGEASLRRALLGFLAEGQNPPDPSQLLLTAGGMQGLDLTCKLFIDPGDLVIVESPTYTNGTATISSYEGSILEVPVDESGMQVEAIPELVSADGRKPKLFYTIPDFQNPSGVTLSLERRHRLLDLANAYDAVVLEDDPYALLRFEGEPLPALRDLDESGERVIAVYTFSKIIASGLRVGWVVAPPPIIELMIAAKQGMDTCTNVVGQRLVAGFIERDLLGEHLSLLQTEYRRRRDAMTAALADHFSSIERAGWTNPAGGFFLWLTLPESIDASELALTALEHGVAVIPGPAFSPSGRFPNALRLCFTYPDEESIRRGVERLYAAFASVDTGAA